jgi:hypothetical protein
MEVAKENDLGKADFDNRDAIDNTHESDDEIEAPKKPKPEKIDRRRKEIRGEPTEKQKAAWAKALATRDANRRKRAEERQKQEEEHKKTIEEKVVKKALAVKKKQIMKEAVLDVISDDDTPLEVVKEAVAKKRAPAHKVIERIVYKEPPSPRFTFV